MKRCPECYEVYEDQERFCDADGNELLADPTFSRESHAAPPPVSPVVRSVWWPAAALGVGLGLAIGAGVFVFISLSAASVSKEPQSVREPTEVREKAPVIRLASTAPTAPTPEPEASPSPEPEEAAAEPSPAVETKATTAQLNQGPISTGEKPTKANEKEASVQTVIEMSDGSTLDVDAAWEDKQGIWYRRSGLVSFVESSRVKAITARRAAKATDLQDR
jgi:hypothetical protein